MLKRMLAAAALCAAAMSAQEAFEVASIKPGDPAERRMGVGIRPGGRFEASNVPVSFLIRVAYDVQDFQIDNLPGWAKTEKYSIEAKSGGDGADDPRTMTKEQRDMFQKRLQLKLQALLADRFGLKLHRETREMPVYALTVAKSGAKMSPSPEQKQGAPERRIMMGRGHLEANSMTMDSLAHALSDQTGRAVIDKTGLTGSYDFKLDWTPDPGQMAGMALPPGAEKEGPPAPDTTGPSLFTAIQEQLGLKLEAARGPVEVLVVDHVEKPSAN